MGEPAFGVWLPQALVDEIWRPVVAWEGSYEVSNLGRVRSVERTRHIGRGAFRSFNGKLLKPHLQMHGYLIVKLRRSGTDRLDARVHRLVAEAFVPNANSKPDVNHLDCDRSNNCASNLEWCTQSENLAYMSALGRRVNYWIGKRSPNANLTNDVVVSIRNIHALERTTHQQLADQFGVSKKVITNILNRRTYTDV